MSLRDDILRHLERRDALPPPRDPWAACLAAATELLLRAELQRQTRSGESADGR